MKRIEKKKINPKERIRFRTPVKNHVGGRPPKFREPRRPVTMTLPERILRLLAAVDKDRARAVVKVTDAALSPADTASKLVQVVDVMPGIGMIVVGASQWLRQIPSLRLIEVAPGRFFLSIPSGTSVESFEITLNDLADAMPSADTRERALVEKLHTLVRALRRGRSISKAEVLLVDTGHQSGTAGMEIDSQSDSGRTPAEAIR